MHEAVAATDAAVLVYGPSRSTREPFRWWIPSFADLFFLSLLIWLFVAGPYGWSGLLADGDTGWHLRTGQYILAHHQVPHQDLFSFSRPGAPWFAWEWLTDVLYALLYQVWGLKGIVLLSGSIIALFAALLCCYTVWKGANPLVAASVTMVAIGAASLHFLARPHLFTLLFLVAALWLVERDRQKADVWIWVLVPLSALWTNLHGGFLVLLACLGLLLAGTVAEAFLERQPALLRAARRYGVLLLACGAASLLNPYGWRLHLYIVEYLRSTWIRDAVVEFQAPSFRTENQMYYQLVLFAGLMTAGLLLSKRRITETLWIAFFAHWSLHSVRHVPLFVLVAAPILAVEVSSAWEKHAAGLPRRAFLRVLWSIGADLAPQFRRASVWVPFCLMAAAILPLPLRWPTDFPEQIFPVRLVRQHQALLQQARVLTDDQWADYLIYVSYPHQRVFIDGRSDFYGPDLGSQYVKLVQGQEGSTQLLSQHGFNAVLAPYDWPLIAALRRDARWRLLATDQKAVLFVKDSR